MNKKRTIDPALSITDKDLTNRYVVLYNSVLKLEYRTLAYRILKANGGFGCKPTLIGRAVFAEGLDGESARWSRSDIERFATDQEVEEAKKALTNLVSVRKEK